MDLILNELTGLYMSADGSVVYDPNTGAVYQYTPYGYQQIGTATNSAPVYTPPAFPSPGWPGGFAPGWPQGSGGLPWWWPQQQPPQRPPAPAGPGAPPQPVYAKPPDPGSVFKPTVNPPGNPQANPVPFNVAPYATPAPAATAPKAGTPVSRQGPPPPRTGGSPAKVVGPPSSGGSITGGGPDPRQGYWEIIAQTDGKWAGSAHENLFERTNLPVKKVRWDSGFVWDKKAEVVMQLKNPAPGYERDYFILYNGGSDNPFSGPWDAMWGIQVRPVNPF